MSRVDRAYQAGDEVQINYLYNLITGATRSDEQYSWEWLQTWNGQGSIWLAFDETREKGDQLIGQYSLIPTPMSFWGKPYLAGKTENCMSHPQFRGKGMYFFHEQKYFEEAKKRYSVFFTTAGHVARGAPGKVRQKLGYRPFDHWVTFSYWLNKADLRAEILSKIPGIFKKINLIKSGLAYLITQLLFVDNATRLGDKTDSFQLLSEAQAPLEKIENLWKENASAYGISIDRTAAYMKWRISENPYLTHKYLCYYKGDSLLGYLIYTIEGSIVHIVDMIVSERNQEIHKRLFEELKHISSVAGLSQIKCSTSSKNQFFINRLSSSKFMNYQDLFSCFRFSKKQQATQLFVYLSEDQVGEPDQWDNHSWYITDLMKEGRPYTARLIG
ncbi:MAG: GNAT family N-acetyltransferase [Candidatus Marinimicrobia bacterium]|nr:GNAT family N-acetyltransferase [Candidatus Neomarinimicrobiota bacterium]